MDPTPAASGYVYVLVNEAMPGLVKIGLTTADDPNSRVDALYTTGVPLPFELVYAGLVDDPRVVEAALHNAFRDARVNRNREFFRLHPDQPIGLLRLLAHVEVTAEIQRDVELSIDEADRVAVAEQKKRRPQIDFSELGVPVGGRLVFDNDPAVVVEVVSNKKVRLISGPPGYEGTGADSDEASLSPLTRDLLGLSYYIAPLRYWTFGGRSMRDIYEATYYSETD